MTAGIVFLNLLCVLLLTWTLVSCWKANRAWWAYVARGLEQQALRRFFAQQLAAFGEARLPLLPFPDAAVVHLYQCGGWTSYDPDDLRELLAREQSDQLATTLRVIDVIYQITGQLDRRAVHRLLTRLPDQCQIEPYLPEPGVAVGYETMEAVGQGFHVRRVLRPGFRYASGEVLRRATVEVDA